MGTHCRALLDFTRGFGHTLTKSEHQVRRQEDRQLSPSSPAACTGRINPGCLYPPRLENHHARTKTLCMCALTWPVSHPEERG